MAKANRERAHAIAATKGAQSEEERFPRKSVPLRKGETERDTAVNMAVLVTSPELAAYRVINAAEEKSGLGQHIDVPTLLAQLRDEAAKVNCGSLARAEAMMMNQATALQSLFSRLSERGMGCDTLELFEANMRMALRAQSQCRATLETLAAIKNPPVLFARQANVTSGPQQINNGVLAPSHAGASENRPSKLLEATNGERLDTRAASAAGLANQELETVGAIHRAANGRGKGKG